MWDVIQKEKPDVILMAFPCTPWSIIQNMNMTDPWRKMQVEKARHEDQPLLDLVVQVARHQENHGKYYVIENPTSSRAWNQSPLKELRKESSQVVFHMCTMGLTDPYTGERLRKTTRLVTNSSAVTKRLQDKTCMKVCGPVGNGPRTNRFLETRGSRKTDLGRK